MHRALPSTIGAALLYVLLTGALTYPLLGRMGSSIAHDAGDPLLNTWILWWSTQAVPFTAAWWNAPIFHPMANAMALSEVLVGLVPLSATVQLLTGNPLTAYNVVFLLSFPLCGLTAFALALALTGRRDAALVAGIAFAFAPYRMGQLSHLQMLSWYWGPLALLGLHRFLKDRQPAMLVLFAAAWLMQALSNGYAMFHLSVLIVLWVLWFVRDLRTFVSIGGAWAAAVLPLVPVLLRYRTVHDELHLVRDINEVKRFGADLADFLSAPRDLVLWDAFAGSDQAETALFPGATVLVVGLGWVVFEWRRGSFREERPTRMRQMFMVMAAAAAVVAFSTIAVGPWQLGPLTVSTFHKPFSIAVGFRLLASLRSSWMRAAWHRRSVAGFYLVAMASVYLLALGPEPRLLGRPLLYEPPYAWLMRVPGFDVMRVPARFAMAGVLCQSLLLAFAIARWARGPRAERQPLLVGAICFGLLADGWVRLPVASAPERGPDIGSVAAFAELPVGDAAVDFGAMYRSMFHKAPIVNAFSGYYPPHYLPLAHAIRHGRFAALRELSSDGPLGVGVSAMRRDAGELVAGLERSEGIVRGPADRGWITFQVAPRAPVPLSVGEKIRISRVVANRHPEDVARMLDGSVKTAWGSGINQIGDEEITIDLGSPAEFGSIVFGMGAYAFGFPRRLDVDVSTDAINWTPVWSGETSVATVRAAVTSPSVVPLPVEVESTRARFIRLRQRGAEPGIPWWIAELEVYGPTP